VVAGLEQRVAKYSGECVCLADLAQEPRPTAVDFLSTLPWVDARALCLKLGLLGSRHCPYASCNCRRRRGLSCRPLNTHEAQPKDLRLKTDIATTESGTNYRTYIGGRYSSQPSHATTALMLNRDINSRFEDWLLSPSEALDFEVKQWLDMSDVEHQGLVAKALIALENHGGGFLLFGYKEDSAKKLVPDPKRPASLEPYLTDSINAVIKRRAEPNFHAQVTLQRHPQTGEEYPLVRVTGSTRVPVRSDSKTPNGTLKENVYYIRAPGPESRAPLNAAEWDALLRRVVLNHREEIIALLRAFLPVGGTFGAPPEPNEVERLQEFLSSSVKQWVKLNSSLDATHPARISFGHYIFAARLAGTPNLHYS
jgi:hypothetical protein